MAIKFLYQIKSRQAIWKLSKIKIVLITVINWTNRNLMLPNVFMIENRSRWQFFCSFRKINLVLITSGRVDLWKAGNATRIVCGSSYAYFSKVSSIGIKDSIQSALKCTSIISAINIYVTECASICGTRWTRALCWDKQLFLLKTWSSILSTMKRFYKPPEKILFRAQNWPRTVGLIAVKSNRTNPGGQPAIKAK